MSESCDTFLTVSRSDFIVNWVLVAGIYISFVPQHVKVIRKRTSLGLSPSYLLQGSISAFASFVNMYLETVRARHCCTTTLNSYQCANSLTNYVQVGVQAIGFCLNIFLCVYLTKNSPGQSREQYKFIYRYYLFFLIYVAINFVTCVCVVHSPTLRGHARHHGIHLYADISGIISTILQITQYVPQLWTTFKLKDPGTLSIPCLFIQCPGSFYWAYSIYAGPGDPSWSSYVPFFAAASLMGILLIMCVWYRYVAKRVKKWSRSASDDSVGEEMTQRSVTTHADEERTLENSAAVSNAPSSPDVNMAHLPVPNMARQPPADMTREQSTDITDSDIHSVGRRRPVDVTVSHS